jgi:hypothetical protein
MLRRTGFTVDLDAPDIHPFLHMFLETYILEHRDLLQSSGMGISDELNDFYAELAEALVLRFAFVQAEDVDGFAFAAHLEVSMIGSLQLSESKLTPSDSLTGLVSPSLTTGRLLSSKHYW